MQQDLRGLFERALDDEPPPPDDPVGRAMAHGRRIRRRRGLLVGGSAAVAAVAVLATVNVALAPAEPPPPVSAAAMVAMVSAPCAEPLREADQVSIFLNQDVTESQRTSLEAALRADPLVRDLQFESREQAYAKFVELWKDSPDFVASITPAALPESFQLNLAEPAGYPRFAAKFQQQGGVEDVIGRPCTGAPR